MGKRNLYLKTTPVEEARTRYLEALEKTWTMQYETIPVVEALGRVTRHAVYAKYSSPLYNASAMDGIAVISSHTYGASETSPVRLKEGEDYVVVDTGDPIHHPFDAVIMAEDLLETESEQEVEIVASAASWQHVRPVGEDIVAGEMILPSCHQIRSPPASSGRAPHRFHTRRSSRRYRPLRPRPARQIRFRSEAP